MKDCENEVYTQIATALRAVYPNISISAYGDNIPSSFPHVSVEMSDNTTLFRVMDSGNYEVSICVFDINIYSNKQAERKKECRDIAKLIDGVLVPQNFRRMEMTPLPNKNNPNIYRIFARYRVATDGKYFYRR